MAFLHWVKKLSVLQDNSVHCMITRTYRLLSPVMVLGIFLLYRLRKHIKTAGLWEQESLEKTYIWSTDLHVSPIACNEEIYQEAGAIVHAEIDFPNCMHYPKHCAKNLKVLSWDDWRGFSLDPCPNDLRKRFYEAYVHDREFAKIDAFICSHPVANCELYIPFNKTIIVYATTRLEFGRNDPLINWRKPMISNTSAIRWSEWLTNLAILAKKSNTIVAANNLYDAKYIEYFTGIKPLYLPSWCGKMSNWSEKELFSTLRNKQETVVLGPYRDNINDGWNHSIYQGLTNALKDNDISRNYQKMIDIYPRYDSMDDFKKFPCIVLIPYQVSLMSFFELYRIGIPIYVPSKKLLLEWHEKYRLLAERTYGTPERDTLLKPYYSGAKSFKVNSWRNLEIDKHFYPINWKNELADNLPYPNDDSSLKSWIDFSDFYVFPHISTFESWDQLVKLIEEREKNGDHISIRYKMLNHSDQQRKHLIDTWRFLFTLIKLESRAKVKSSLLTYEESIANTHSDPEFGNITKFNEGTHC